MCELVRRKAGNYSQENFSKSPANIFLIPKSEELVCQAPEYKDNISFSPVLPQKEKQVNTSKIIKFSETAISEDANDQTIQSVTNTASTLTSTLNKVPNIIANIAELETNSALMLRVSKWAGPTAKIITDTKAFRVAGKIVGNPLIAKGAGTLGVISGGFEIKKGIKEMYKNQTAEGAFHIADGTSNVFAGAGLVLGKAKVSSAGAAFGIGITVGHFGDKSAKDLGWFKDKYGKTQSVSDRLGDRMWDIHDSVLNSTGNDILAHAAGIGSGLIMLPAAGVIALGGALTGGSIKVGEGVSSAWSYVFK